MAVPLGVLKAASIRFSPPLPVRKQEAIQRLGFGLLNKARPSSQSALHYVEGLSSKLRGFASCACAFSMQGAAQPLARSRLQGYAHWLQASMHTRLQMPRILHESLREGMEMLPVLVSHLQKACPGLYRHPYDYRSFLEFAHASSNAVSSMLHASSARACASCCR